MFFVRFTRLGGTSMIQLPLACISHDSNNTNTYAVNLRCWNLHASGQTDCAEMYEMALFDHMTAHTLICVELHILAWVEVTT